MKKQGLIRSLVFSVAGLYASFLSWSLLQERINTKPYGFDPILGKPDFFKAPLVVNIIQALFAGIVGLFYSWGYDGVNPFAVFTQRDDNNGTILSVSLQFVKLFMLIAATSSLSSPLGYKLLKHVDYLAFLLAKSCKLIPVLLIHTVFYRTKFPLYKYLVAGAVSIGVVMFTLAHSSSKESSQPKLNDGQTVLGMMQLVGSMILDGLTNSTQDQLFKLSSSGRLKVKLTGGALMCILNVLTFILSLSYAILIEYDGEISYTRAFVAKYPSALVNILLFSALGAVGQVFVFIILERFDLLVLVTATVTRKMISMMLSVVLFGHSLTITQWLGVILVFVGIGVEAFAKPGKKKMEIEEEVKKKQ